MMKVHLFNTKTLGVLSLFLVAMLALSACQAAPSPPEATAPVIPTENSAASAAEVALQVANDPDFGEILVDDQGMTLYMFTVDELNKSNCNEACLQAWPPLLAEGEVVASEGVDSSLIGTGTMLDGRNIVTYNGMPLYYWAGDAQPGDTSGQGVNDVWYVVSPEGEVIGMDETMPVTGSTGDPVVVNTTAHSTFGQILVDSEGMTLYMFTVDEPNQSNCNEGCLQAWPPLLAEGEVVAGEGVDSSLIGTGTMLDGRSIVTYNEMPLYYWAGDTQPGDTNGQGVNDVWFVVSPQGEMIDQEISSSSPAENDDAVMVNVTNHSQYGKILVDGRGMTLYMFTRDEPNKSNCADGCLDAWPPLLAIGEVQAGEGVEDALLGTADLADGRKIVTYNKLPLYYWAGDTKPGDSSGQNVNEVWFVMSPQGKPVGMSSGSEVDDDDGYDY